MHCTFIVLVIPFYYSGSPRNSTITLLYIIVIVSVCAVVLISALVVIICWLYKRKFKAKSRNDVMLNQTSTEESPRDHVYEDVQQMSPKPAVVDTNLTQNIAYGCAVNN